MSFNPQKFGENEVIRTVGLVVLLCAFGGIAGCASQGSVGQPSADIEAVSTGLNVDGFNDAVHHWQNRYGNDYPRYSAGQVREIANNILLMQRDHGGWIENLDPLRILSTREKAQLIVDKTEEAGSFDNRNIYTQISYLMGAYEVTGEEMYRTGALKGLDYLLAHQTECGGWPHTVPASRRYHPLITIADEVTSGPLEMLRPMSAGDFPFASLSDETKERARRAVERGDNCLLRLQIRQQDGLAGWAGQYTPDTLEPAMGRSFELPSMAVQETVEILRYLMSIDQPSPEEVAAIEGGVSWLQRVALQGVRLDEYELSEPVAFRYHIATRDRRLVPDETAPPLWARFYDVTDNSVVLANRDSVRVDDLQDIAQERRTGYDWYGTWADHLVSVEYPEWKSALAGE